MQVAIHRSALMLIALAGLVSIVAPTGTLVAATTALAAPEPEPVPRRWQIDSDVGPLRVTSVTQPDGSTAMYFYLTYKISNSSDKDQLFAGSFELATGDGQPQRSGREVSTEVTKAIIATLDNPFIQDQISIMGTLLRGPEHAREGVVIWPAKTLKPTDLNVYISGLSGETAVIELPTEVIARQNAQPPAGDKPEAAKPEAKPVAKREAKPEAGPEAKPEAQPVGG